MLHLVEMPRRQHYIPEHNTRSKILRTVPTRISEKKLLQISYSYSLLIQSTISTNQYETSSVVHCPCPDKHKRLNKPGRIAFYQMSSNDDKFHHRQKLIHRCTFSHSYLHMVSTKKLPSKVLSRNWTLSARHHAAIEQVVNQRHTPCFKFS